MFETPSPAPRREFLRARLFGNASLALLALLWPAVGPNRFFLAAFLVLIVSPGAVLTELRYPAGRNPWALALFDTASLVVLCLLVPEIWICGLVVGLLITGSSSVRTPRGTRAYLGLQLLLLGGLAASAVLHGLEGWLMPLTAVLFCTPTVAYYARWEASRAQELRDHGQRLEALTLFAGGLAHDFNNMLTSIVANTDLALYQMSADHPARRRVEQIMQATSRAQLFTAQLRALSSDSLREEPLDLAAEATDLSHLLVEVVPSGVELVVQADEGLPKVMGDRAQLQQVMMNLIINASESLGGANGQVTVDLRADGDEVVCVVRDTGRGIPAPALARIFDPFFSSKGEGRGLGLSTLPGVLRRHGGSVAVESTVGVGTAFTLRLPAMEGQAPESSLLMAARLVTAPPPTDVVLLIDDDPGIRQMAPLLLAELGYVTRVAECGQTGISALKAGADRICAVVLDLKMPGMNGWECLEKIRNSAPNLPVVISSGFDPDEEGLAQERSSYDSFLPKPYRLEELQRALDHARTRSGSVAA